jgi:hypothetical protein
MFEEIDEDPEAQFEIQLQAFFLWYATAHKGVGAERPTTETMVHYVTVFSKANNERSDHKISRQMGDGLRDVCSLPFETLSLADQSLVHQKRGD